jgi:hypothetical protein
MVLHGLSTAAESRIVALSSFWASELKMLLDMKISLSTEEKSHCADVLCKLAFVAEGDFPVQAKFLALLRRSERLHPSHVSSLFVWVAVSSTPRCCNSNL